MKKLLVAFLTLILALNVVNAEEKVKVYMFEAGGCPFCEKEEEYLKSLSGYGKTFELIKKELYIDHVQWAEGKDYSLGKKVAEAFLAAGFNDASYQSTPFVVISDIYAVAGYDDTLEEVINLVYEEGDNDAVSCIESGRTDCIRGYTIPERKEVNNKAGVVLVVVSVLALVGVVVYLIKNNPNVEVVEEKEIEEKKEVKEEKVTPKATTKKTQTKTTNKKSTAKKTQTKKTTTKKK